MAPRTPDHDGTERDNNEVDSADDWQQLILGAGEAPAETSADAKTVELFQRPSDADEDTVLLHATTTGAEAVPATEELPPPGRRAALLALWRRGRALWITVGIAVLSLVLGLLVGRFAISPADAAAAAKPPKAGPVTVAVTSEELSSSVTARGDVAFANATEVNFPKSDEPQVVTGHVPAKGDPLNALSIALEVAGRPLIVLPGDLPAYRTLSLGMSGPDVVQFKQAMVAAGIGVGDVNSNVFDADSAAAVKALYDKAGYPAPTSDEAAEETLKGAKEAYTSAKQGLSSAQAALRTASAGPKASEIQTADNGVRSAQRALDSARAAANAAVAKSPQDPAEVAQAQAAVGDAEDALSLAQTQRNELNAAPDTSEASAGVASAKEQLDQAADTLKDAQDGVLPSLPETEVLYLGGLPRQVSEVTVARGDTLGKSEDPALTISSAVLEITATVGSADADKVTTGGDATYTGDDGKDRHAVVASVTPSDDESGKVTVTLTPDALTPDEVTALAGTNVRVSVPIKSTDGKVLAVPLAAVVTGANGGSKVEVVEGDPASPEAKRHTVKVTTGLAAGDLIEVRPANDDLAVGDLVVVGK
ncbi:MULTISPECIES: hypothetical protein [unclassified Microbacterium]|uniref:hypothetical protein n=1 Tax=unclassified Microbacterium TaxID=2609290 RepID=UPI00301995CA